MQRQSDPGINGTLLCRQSSGSSPGPGKERGAAAGGGSVAPISNLLTRDPRRRGSRLCRPRRATNIFRQGYGKVPPPWVACTLGHALLRIREVGTPWAPKQEEAQRASAAILKKGEAPSQ